MDCNCCLFFGKRESEELRGRVKASSREKTDKKELTIKIEETYKKIFITHPSSC